MTPVQPRLHVHRPKETHLDLRRSLLRWARTHRRDLPWRTEPRDPYRVWVSEVMLQQTQVTTVIPYFTRFMARFPDVTTLAAASPEEVLKAWEGLGYYRRARHLHRAAQIIVQDYAGQIPTTSKELQKLPGIGRSTAGAMASLAFGERVAVLDGNVRRVLCRLYAIQENPRAPAVEKQLWQLAESLLPPTRPGDWNEALMELGATICTPRAPDCPHCPLRDCCQARAQGCANTLPVQAARKALPHYDVTAAIIRKRGKILVAQRHVNDGLGGLWEFPGGKCRAGETLEECLRRELEEELGIEVRVGRKVMTLKHAHTHQRITLHFFECRHVAGRVRALDVADWRWVRPAGLSDLPFSAPDQKVIALIQNER